MQNVVRACCIPLLVLLATAACQTVGRVSAQDGPAHFPTAEQAVRKARDDFASALRANPGLQLGVDLATLERSQPGRPVRRADLDFDRLVAADPAQPLEALVRSERTTVVPLIADGTVVTIVEVNRDAGGWKVVGLAGKDIADELNVVRKAAGATPQTEITLYEVPNLQTRIYSVKQDGAEILFTELGQRFTLSQGVRPAALIPALRTAAIDFRQKYGEELKRRQLLR